MTLLARGMETEFGSVEKGESGSGGKNEYGERRALPGASVLEKNSNTGEIIPQSDYCHYL